MNLFTTYLVFFGLFNAVVPEDLVTAARNERETEACFCDQELGCFHNNAPWTSLMRPFPCPWSPEKVGINFKLFSNLSSEAYIITQWPKIILEGSNYDPSKKTVVAVHGYNGVNFSKWMYTLKDVLLEKEEGNFIVVDWSQGSGTAFSEYFQAASNTRTVGAALARLLKHLVKSGQAPTNIHCVGHSLGAHVCGYAAKELKKHDMQIGQITGLDVAQPGFEGEPVEVRLAKGDAEFSVAMHTDAVNFIPCLGFGMVNPLADIDLYMNGGSNQPGCSYTNLLTSITSISDIANIPEDVQKKRACSHKKATDYYIAAVEKEDCMIGKKISSTTFSRVNSVVCVNAIPMTSDVNSCSQDTCVAVGLGTINSTARGSFLVRAAGEPPYCTERKRSATGSSSCNSIWENMASPIRTLFQPLQRLWTWSMDTE